MGNVFIYFTVKEIMRELRCGNQKASRILKELEKIGLIVKKRQGLCKPNRLYVKNILTDYNYHASHTPQITSNYVCQSHGNKTDINKTENNNSPSYEEEIISLKEHFEYDLIIKSPHLDKEMFSTLFRIMAETAVSKKRTFFINGENMPKERVAERFYEINHMHLEYVIDVIKESTEVKHPRNYMLTLIYNSINNIDAYYDQLYRKNCLNNEKNI